MNYRTGEVKNVHYGDILITFGDILHYNDPLLPFITNANVINYKDALLRDGDIIIADAAEDESVGKAVEVIGIGEGYLVSGLHTIANRPKKHMVPMYLGYFINSPSYHHQLFSIMQGVKVLSLSRRNLSNTSILFPDHQWEQEKIVSLFTKIESLITLHQRAFILYYY